MARIRLEVQPTETQYSHVFRAAKLAGLSMADYLRLLIQRDMKTEATRRRRNAGNPLRRTRLQM